MKAKRILFWAVTIVATPWYLAWIILMSIWQIGPGLVAVFELAHFRFECWAHDVQRGDLLNCPWKRSYKEAFIHGYQGL